MTFFPIPHPEPEGFTLLEALVVIALVALVAGLVFPRIDRTLEAVQFASARSTVAVAVEAARAEAVRTKSTVTLQASGDRRSLLSNGRISAVLPQSVQLGTSQSEPRFFGDGSVAGGTVSIASGRSRAELQVMDGTGLVRWQQ